MQGFPGRRHRQPDRRSDGVGDHFTAANRSIIPFYKACTRRCAREPGRPRRNRRPVSRSTASPMSERLINDLSKRSGRFKGGVFGGDKVEVLIQHLLIEADQEGGYE